MNKEEKEKLTNLIESNNGENWWIPENFNLNTFIKLPSQLKLISLPPNYEDNYNCFAYAFGLSKYKEFLGGNNPVQQEFIVYLFNKGLLISTDSPINNDLIFWRNDANEITHVGIIKEKQIIISKWMWGPIFEHDINDVPSSFGQNIFYCKKPDTGFIKNEYEKYKASGVEIKPIS